MDDVGRSQMTDKPRKEGGGSAVATVIKGMKGPGAHGELDASRGLEGLRHPETDREHLDRSDRGQEAPGTPRRSFLATSTCRSITVPPTL
jgi:hypothetical protein